MGMTHEVKRAVKGGCSRLKKQAPGSKVCAWWSQETVPQRGWNMESGETSLWMEMRIYQVSLGDRSRVIWVKEKVKFRRRGTLTLLAYPVYQTPSC